MYFLKYSQKITDKLQLPENFSFLTVSSQSWYSILAKSSVFVHFVFGLFTKFHI